MAAPRAFDPVRLETLAHEGRRAAENGDTTAVASALAEREVLLRALAAPPPASDVERIRAALATVQAVDADTERLLRAESEALRAELRALGEGRRGLAGYAGCRMGAGSRIDERG